MHFALQIEINGNRNFIVSIAKTFPNDHAINRDAWGMTVVTATVTQAVTVPAARIPGRAAGLPDCHGRSPAGPGLRLSGPPPACRCPPASESARDRDRLHTGTPAAAWRRIKIFHMNIRVAIDSG
jgi:hypothetical protein